MITEQDWIDDVAIARALAGQKIGRSLTEAERRYIADLLVSQGKGTHAISRATRCNGTTAVRLLREAVERANRAEGGAAA